MDTLKEQVTYMSHLALNNPLHGLGLVAGAFIFYISAIAIQRAYFHPLSHIPGPWLAKVSYWAEFYHDCLAEGYVKVYPKLHAKYGICILKVISLGYETKSCCRANCPSYSNSSAH